MHHRPCHRRVGGHCNDDDTVDGKNGSGGDVGNYYFLDLVKDDEEQDTFVLREARFRRINKYDDNQDADAGGLNVYHQDGENKDLRKLPYTEPLSYVSLSLPFLL
jgi:hypothetical protein